MTQLQIGVCASSRAISNWRAQSLGVGDPSTIRGYATNQGLGVDLDVGVQLRGKDSLMARTSSFARSFQRLDAPLGPPSLVLALAIAACSSPTASPERPDGGRRDSETLDGDARERDAAETSDGGPNGADAGLCAGMVCPQVIDRCVDGVCVSPLDLPCSESNPYGVCPGNQECSSAGCSDPYALDAASGAMLPPAQMNELFDGIFDSLVAAYPFNPPDWAALEKEYRALFASRKTLRSAYWAIGQMLAKLEDSHADAYSSYLCSTNHADVYRLATPPGLSMLDACGTTINGKYIIYEAGTASPINLGIGDRILSLGPYDMPAWKTYREESEALCGDVSSPSEAHRQALFDDSALYFYLYGASAELIPAGMTSSVTRTRTALSARPCFGFPMRYRPNMGTSSFHSETLASGVGYLHVRAFADIAGSAEIDQFFADADPQKGVVIDLRSNTGGYIPDMTGLLSYLVSGDTLIATCEENVPGQFGVETELSVTPHPSIHFAGKVAVLTNRRTKSGGEFFAMAVKRRSQSDPKRVFGEPTAGALSLASTLEISVPSEHPDTWRILLPSGRCRDSAGTPLATGVGIVPDEEIPQTEQSLASGTDLVLERALDWLAE